MRRAASLRRRVVRARGLALGLVLALAACGMPAPSPTPSASPDLATPPPAATATPTATDAAPTDAASPSASAAIAFDATLLDVLPAELDGVPLTPAPEAIEDIPTDSDVLDAADAMAFGVLVEPTSGELAVVSVVGLRDGVYDETFFRGWRDSFDAGVCEPAGGVVGNAEAELGGRTVYITSCVEGVRSYHAYLPNRNVFLTVTHVGTELRLGERLIEAATDAPG